MQRASGILLAVSSLPAPYGIGNFGAAAREWLRFLSSAGQRYWQILPLGVTGWGDSPYQSFSAFAISPYYIDFDALREAGLLEQADIDRFGWGRNAERVNYAALYRGRRRVLEKACERFSTQRNAQFESFCEENAHWLDDYALFMALKAAHRGEAWTRWESGCRLRNPAALARFAKRSQKRIAYYRFEQWCAFSQWKALRGEAAALGVKIIGDMPIYVAMDSADVWAHPELFELDAGLNPVRVAGCPPDPFSATGQLWGNPLYNWQTHAASGFSWWKTRLRESFRLFDVLRIDHFRGLESYYAINAGESDARNGVWVTGPGGAFIDAVREALPGAEIIAEDLGYISPEVKALLDYSGFPGMKVVQFAFDSRESGDYMPHNYPHNAVVYTGTHDNTTSADWFKQAKAEDIALSLEYLNAKGGSGAYRAFIRAALASVARLAVIPMQDWLGLDGRARMNTPSSLGTNWQWRMKSGAASASLAAEIRQKTELYGR